MYPELFHIGSLTIYSYGFLILIGVIIAYFYFKKQSAVYGVNSEQVSELFLFCIAGVFIGGKFFFYLEEPSKYLKNPSEMLDNIGQGFVFYGSFLCTVPILIWWFRKNKLPVWDMFDLVGISGAITHGFGKLGCLMAGCCHGKVCKSSLGIIFTNTQSSAEPIGVPLYPTQIWDALIIFSAVFIMILVKKRKQFAGQLFLIYGLWYAVGRFVTEKYRGDESRGYLFNGALSHSQFIAIVIFLIAASIYIYRLKSEKSKHAV